MKPTCIIAILSLVFTASITLHAQDTTTPQPWTASDGKVIQAKFIKLDGESVVIEKDGNTFAVPFAKLNAESVALAKKLGIAVRPLSQFGKVPQGAKAGSSAASEASSESPDVTDPTGTSGQPTDLPGAQSLSEAWLPNIVRTRDSERCVVPLFDHEGNLVIQAGVKIGTEVRHGLVKLSGGDGSLMWAVAPDQIEPGAWYDPTPWCQSIVGRGSYNGRAFRSLMLGPSDEVIGVVEAVTADQGRDLVIFKLASKDGAFLWKQRYDGPQKGDDAAKGLLVGDDGAVVLNVSAGGLPTSKAMGKMVAPSETHDAVVIRLAGKDGSLTWEFKGANTPELNRCELLTLTGDCLIGLFTAWGKSTLSSRKLFGISVGTGAKNWEKEMQRKGHFAAFADPNALLIARAIEPKWHEMVWSSTDEQGDSAWQMVLDQDRTQNDTRTIVTSAPDGSVWIRYSGPLVPGAVGAPGSGTDRLELASQPCMAKIRVSDGKLLASKMNVTDPIQIGLTPEVYDPARYVWLWRQLADKNGDLIVLWFDVAAPGRSHHYTPSIAKLSGADGSEIWRTTMPMTAQASSGDQPLARLDPEGNVLLALQEQRRDNETGIMSLVKIGGKDGKPIWHQRWNADLGRASNSNSAFVVDPFGNPTVVFSRASSRPSSGPGAAGPNGSTKPVTVVKFFGATGAAAWIKEMGSDN